MIKVGGSGVASSAGNFVSGVINGYVGNVKVADSSAFGDGVADATAHIQGLLDAVAVAGGGAVFLPAGNYKCGTNLLIGDKTMLYGAGVSSRIIAPLASGAAIRNVNSETAAGNSDAIIKDITIDLQATGKNGIKLAGVDRGTIHNVRIINPAGYGIWLYRTDDSASGEGKPTKHVTVSDCHITGVVDVGVEYSGAVACTTVGCTVTGTAGIAGYYAWNGATDCVFSGNVAEGEGVNPAFRGFSVQPKQTANPAPSPTQTQRISFIGNVARNVRFGFHVTATTGNEPTDILVEGNTFFGQGVNDVGVDISCAKRVTVKNNQIVNFYNPLGLSRPAAAFDSASYVAFDGNRIYGGSGCLLYGNIGGSFSGNSIVGTANHAVQLYAWRGCTINDNVFVNIGGAANAACLVVRKSGTTEATGNTFVGNKALDDRATKYTAWLIDMGDASDYNIITSNSAYGAKAGASVLANGSTGVNNVSANNING